MTQKERHDKLIDYYIDRYEVSYGAAMRMILDKQSQDNELKNNVKYQVEQKYEKKIEKLNSDHTKWTNELKAKIERLSKDDTRLKELLSQYIELTEALDHRIELTSFSPKNRDFSAGYVKALQDLMKHFEGIDYEIIE